MKTIYFLTIELNGDAETQDHKLSDFINSDDTVYISDNDDPNKDASKDYFAEVSFIDVKTIEGIMTAIVEVKAEDDFKAYGVMPFISKFCHAFKNVSDVYYTEFCEEV